jgi:hypothetical protein
MNRRRFHKRVNIKVLETTLSGHPRAKPSAEALKDFNTAAR